MKKYPFKFLDSYNQNDRDMFFGRDEEIEALYEMIFQNSILLLYGGSGTGKTSLIQCGLAGKFKSYDWLALTIRRGTDINASLEKALIDAGGNDLDDDDALTKEPGNKLTGLLRLIKGVYLNSFKPIYLIFDQFEELYVLGTKAEQEKFIGSVKEILTAEQPVKMIFSIREEYLGHLYEFEKEVPRLLRKKLRVEPMTLNKVTDVIKGINNFKLSNVRIKTDEIDAITQGIFDRIKGKKKTLTIQLPYLQVFLDKLYIETTKDETRQADALITMEVLNRIGDIGDVLRNFLEEQVKNISQKLSVSNKNVSPETIWKILSPFSTLEGTKEPISKKELSERLPGMDKKLIDEAVESFVNSRILNFSENANLYELAHDSLALRIKEKRSDEEITLLEVRRLIKGQVALKQDAREFFSRKQLNFIEPYLSKLNLAEDEKALIAQSKEAHHKAESRRKARRKSILITIGTVTILVIGILSFFLFQASIARNKNRLLLTNQYWNNSRSKTAESDYVYALTHANKAFSLSKDKDFKENILSEIEDQWPVISLKNIFSGKSQIADAAFNEDGKQMLTISKDFTVRKWNVETGELLETKKPLPVKTSGRSGILGFLFDGKTVLITDAEDRLQIWNVLTSQEVKSGVSGDSTSSSVTFSFDGSKYLRISLNDPPSNLYTLVVQEFNGKPLFSKQLNHEAAEFSPDGQWILAKHEHAKLKFFNSKTGKEKILDLKITREQYPGDDGQERKFETFNYKSTVTNAYFNPNGSKVLTIADDSTVRIWDAVTAIQATDSMKHQRIVKEAIFSPDGAKILTIDDERSTYIWDAATGKYLGHAFKLEPNSPLPAFSPDGKQILSIIGGVAAVWDILQKNASDNKEINSDDLVVSPFYSPDFNRIAHVSIRNDSLVYRIFDAEKGEKIGIDIVTQIAYTWDVFLNRGRYLYFSPDGKTIVTRYSAGTLQLWTADSAKHIGNIPFHHSGDLIFSPDSKTIITKYEEGSMSIVQLWSAEKGTRIGSDLRKYQETKQVKAKEIIEGQDPGLSAVYQFNRSTSFEDPDALYSTPIFSADGKWILIIMNSNDTVYYQPIDTRTGDMKWANPKYQLQADFVNLEPWTIFSPDGKWILSATSDNNAQLVDVATGKLKRDNLRYFSRWHPVFSPDGKWILSGSTDSTIQFIETETGNQIGNAIKHVSPYSPVINLDSSRVLTIGDPETIHLWNAETQKQIKEGFKHEFDVPLAFSPDGKLFLTAEYPGTVRVYDAKTGSQKGSALRYSSPIIRKFIFSNNSKRILVIYGNLESDRVEYTGVIWDAGTGIQVGQAIKEMDFVERGYDSPANAPDENTLKFSPDGKLLLYSSMGFEELLNTKAGDLDIPSDLLDLQISIATGYKYDFEINEKVFLSADEFNVIKTAYNKKASEHYKSCKYPDHNYWKRFNPGEAKKIRPKKIPEYLKEGKYLQAVSDSQFRILPAFQPGDTAHKENNGSYLEPNQAIYSKNREYLLAYRADGDLVIYRKKGMVPIWSTQTHDHPANRTIMQFDGNLVIYSGGSKIRGENPIWSSGTYINNRGAYLVLEDNGNLVIYNSKNEIVWESGSIDEFGN